jgi:hypothetical protein
MEPDNVSWQWASVKFNSPEADDSDAGLGYRYHFRRISSRITGIRSIDQPKGYCRPSAEVPIGAYVFERMEVLQN